MPNDDALTTKLKALEGKINAVIEQQKSTATLQAWLSFGKFVLGSFVVGILTAVLNHQIQSTELEMKEKEQEKEYVGNFLTEAMDDNLEKRVRFAHYFAQLLEGRWTAYYQHLQQEFNSEQAKLTKANEMIAQLQKKMAEAEAELEAAKSASEAAKIDHARNQAALASASLRVEIQRAAELEANLSPMPRSLHEPTTARTTGDWALMFSTRHKSLEDAQERVTRMKSVTSDLLRIVQDGNSFRVLVGKYSTVGDATKARAALQGNRTVLRAVRGNAPIPPPIEVVNVSLEFGTLTEISTGVFR